MSSPFIAEIRIFAGNFAIQGWAFCDGQLLQIAQNTALFSLVGTIYGGDGRTTFGLPNIQGRAPMHAGNGPGLTNRNLGTRGGTETVAVTAAQIGQHSHTLKGVDADAQSTDPTNSHLATSNEDNYHDMATPTVAMSSLATGAFAGQAHDNMQPYLTLNFIIALVGEFPSRN